jgi:hypothetical protein
VEEAKVEDLVIEEVKAVVVEWKRQENLRGQRAEVLFQIEGLLEEKIEEV